MFKSHVRPRHTIHIVLVLWALAAFEVHVCSEPSCFIDAQLVFCLITAYSEFCFTRNKLFCCQFSSSEQFQKELSALSKYCIQNYFRKPNYNVKQIFSFHALNNFRIDFLFVKISYLKVACVQTSPISLLHAEKKQGNRRPLHAG